MNLFDSVPSVLFLLFSLAAVASAVAVILFRNPVYSALALVLHLVVIAGLFAFLGAHFLAVAQVIVYAGAIVVLFLFVIMLLNIKAEAREPISLAYLLPAALVGVGFLGALAVVVHGGFQAFDAIGTPPEGTVKALGLELYKNYYVQFQVAGVLLLLATVASVLLAQRQKRGGVQS